MCEQQKQIPFATASVVAICLFIWLLLALPAASIAQSAKLNCDVLRTAHAAETLAKQHQEAKAIASLHELERCSTLSEIDRFHIGSLYGKLHDFNDALAAFARLNVNMPSPQAHAYVVALSQLQKGDPAAAVATLTNLTATTALDGDSINLLAVSYAKQGQYQFAYDLLHNRLRGAPKDINAYLNLITLLSDAGQFAQAKQIAQECVAAFPEQSDPLIELGAVETLLGELNDAGKTFREAIRVAPMQSDPRFFLALTEYRLNDFARSKADIQEAAQKGIVNADLLYLLAESSVKLEPGKSEGALRELNKAIVLNPESVPALTLRGKIFLEQGHLERAQADLEVAHSLDPKMRSATYNLSRVYFSAGKRDKAQMLYRQMSAQPTSTIDEVSDQRMRSVLENER
jgi:tetratricopeptide (TPR) repeat protein